MISNPKSSSWHISSENFPAFGLPSEKWKFLLRYAVLAPSSHNSQPWLFHLNDIHLELIADYSRACPVVDPENRELIMSCGCALYHLRTAMRHFGCLGKVQVLPASDNPDAVASLTLRMGNELPLEPDQLFDAIPKRRTNRQAFLPERLPEALVTELQTAAQDQGATLTFVGDRDIKEQIAHLIALGDARQWSNSAFRHELAKWVHANRSQRRDGIPGYAQGIDDLLSYAGPLVVRTFDMGEGKAATNHDLASGSPALAVLLTGRDGLLDWMAAGQALAHVLLRARAHDVWASFLNQPIEIPSLRMNVSHAIGARGFPQAILRFGFGSDINPTPRREVEDLLV